MGKLEQLTRGTVRGAGIGGGVRLTCAKEYMRLVLRERGADHAWSTTGASASGAGAIRLLSSALLQ
jgi:hypothetical protein